MPGMFVDQARIYVKGGDGGNGIVSWRREKYVPLGGPAGGDGGRGGDVVVVVDEGLRTLVDFRYQRHFKAVRGGHGGTKNRHGKSASDLIVRVPPGTVVKDADSEEFLGDLTDPSDRVVVARGGRGGHGNTHFASQNNKAPEMAERGAPGQERWLMLELKVLADVGLVGFPSVGKSTLLSVVSAAKPKIGAYPFTTLSPELGVVQVQDGRSFILADLPGLIEGAHSGAGLGHDFLRHIDRTKVLLHVLDMGAVDGRDPVEDFSVIEAELRQYDPRIVARPRLVAANKMDLPDAVENLRRFQAAYPELAVYPISAVTGQGVPRLLQGAADALAEAEAWRQPVAPDAVASVEKVYRFEQTPGYEIRRDGNKFVVHGAELEKLVHMTNFEQYDAVKRFQRILQRDGVDDALRRQGAHEGDVIQIGDMEFEFAD